MFEYKGKEVILMACSSCNIKRCEHCYISYKGDRKPEDLQEIARNLSQKHDVYINGAEVLVNKHYFDSYKEVKQNWMLTNGFAIYKNPEILQFLKSSGIEIVEMSYHFGIQDEISVMGNQMLESVIEHLKRENIRYKILVTISSENYLMIEEMCEKAISLGAYGIEFTNFLNQGNAQNMAENNMLTIEQIEIFFEQLRRVRKKYTPEILVVDRSGIFGKDKKNPNCHFCCPAGVDSVVITPDNNVYSCIFLAKPGFEIGIYKDNQILLNSDINNSGNLCLAHEFCNNKNEEILTKVLKITKK